jgi:hypothetical protein
MNLKELQESAYVLTAAEVEKMNKTIAADYLEAIKAMDRQLKNTYAKYLTGIKKENYHAVMSKYQRLERLIAETQAEYLKALKKSGNYTKEAAELSLNNMFYRQQYSINWPLDTNTVFTPINPIIAEASVQGTQQAWLNIRTETKARFIEKYGPFEEYLPKAGTLLEELIVNRRAGTLASIETTIRQAIIKGESYTKTAKKISKIMDNDYSKSLRIVRTESQRNANIGNYVATQEARAQGVKIKRQVLAVLDNRTRQQSQQIDGQIANKDDYFVYPGGVKVRTPGNSGVPGWDINDRETVIDIVNGVSPEIRRARDPLKSQQWENATAKERKNKMLDDGTVLFSPSEQTDIISFEKFPEWAKDNGMKQDKNGKWYLPVNK